MVDHEQNQVAFTLAFTSKEGAQLGGWYPCLSPVLYPGAQLFPLLVSLEAHIGVIRQLPWKGAVSCSSGSWCPRLWLRHLELGSRQELGSLLCERSVVVVHDWQPWEDDIDCWITSFCWSYSLVSCQTSEYTRRLLPSWLQSWSNSFCFLVWVVRFGKAPDCDISFLVMPSSMTFLESVGLCGGSCNLGVCGTTLVHMRILPGGGLAHVLTHIFHVLCQHSHEILLLYLLPSSCVPLLAPSLIWFCWCPCGRCG